MSSQTLWAVLNFNSLVLAFLLMMFALWARPQWWPPMLTLFAGLLIGFMAPRTEEIIFIVFLLFAFGFFAGFVQARGAWRALSAAILLAVWVPLNELFALLMNVRLVEPPNPAAALFAFVPALLGTYLGVLIQRTSRAPRAEPTV